MPRSKTQKVLDQEREARVLHLRKAALTFDQIADQLGYADASGAKRAYDRAMQATIQQPADELRVLEDERLDTLLRAVWPSAISGKGWAVQRALQIMERRAKLLGLDAPSRAHVTVSDEMTERIKQLAAQLGVNDPDVSFAS